MKRSLIRVLGVATLGGVMAGFTLITLGAGETDDSTQTIKHVMDVAHKGDKKAGVEPLCKIVLNGKGTHENADELLKLYKELAAAKPPKGGETDWQKRTGALVDAAEQLDQGDAPSTAAIATYKAALDCKGCHAQHKP